MPSVTETFDYRGCDEAADECREFKNQLNEAQDDAAKAAALSAALGGIFLLMGQPALAAIVALIGTSVAIDGHIEDRAQSSVRNCQYQFEDTETFLYDHKNRYDLAKIKVTYENYNAGGEVIPLPVDAEVIGYRTLEGDWILKS